MGFKDMARRERTGFQDAHDYFKIGCELLGRPSGLYGMGTPLERADRVKAGKAEVQRRIARARADERRRTEQENATKREQLENNFGNGEAYGDENWSAPMHATTKDGREVTVSVGRGSRAGHTLICDGHVSRAEFYDRREDGAKGHDHYLVDGRLAADRARFSDDS